MTPYGRPACEVCGRRLTRCKGKLHKSGSGHICHLCYMSAHRPQLSAVPALAPSSAQRSHKRKAASDPGEFVAFPPLALHQLPLFPSHGWSIQESTRRSHATAKSWHELAISSELKLWDEKRTKYWQHDCRLQLTCSFEDEKRVRLLSGSEAIARDVLSWLGVKATHSDLCCDAVKLLRSRKGEGLQDVHYDVPEWRD